MRQKTALEILKTGRNVFLTGAAGTGKTFVLNKYIEWLKENRVPVAVTASTGIAATHLGGQTIHSWSGIGIKDYLSDWDLDALSQKQALVRSVNNASVLIIDEISMLKSTTLDMINTVLKTLRQNDEPFGGLQVIFSGDFFQLPPVVRSNELESFDGESVFAFSSAAWHEAGLKVLYLDEQYRQKDELLDILNAIRQKELTEDLFKKIKSRVGLYPDEERPVRLHTHNANVDKANEEELENLEGKVYEYPMNLSGNKARAENMARNILAPEILRLKEGARVMFVKNDPAGKFVNGSLGTVVSFKYGLPEVELDGGERILVEKMSWEMENESGKVLARVEQLPLRLAWAITVHKSQGMSMDSAIMDLSRTFVEGQGYVALSRVRSLHGLFIEGISDKALQVSDFVFENDQAFQATSEQVANVFENYSDLKVKELQEEFLQGASKKVVEKTPTHIESLKLLHLGSLQKIAKERELKAATIINHLEKAQEEGLEFDMTHLEELQSLDLPKIFQAFKERGFEKLSPVHEYLKGKVSFDELRLARVLFKKELL